MSFANELHKKVTKVKDFRQVVTAGIDDVWAMDLVDMGTSELKVNKNKRYMLTCIDCFSRYAWAIPMESKSESSSLDAFKTILASGRKPERIWTDQGAEFYNSVWKKFLDSKDIGHYSTYSEVKVSMVERFNRTLKTRMWKYFTEHDTKKWIDILDDLVDDYNTTKHSTIRMTPIEASKEENEKELMEKLYPEPAVEEPKFKLGEWVRISRQKGVFEKGYTQTWSKAIYKIVRISIQKPILCYLIDENKEAVEGGFYQNELQKTSQKPEKKPELTNDIPVYDHRFVKTKSKALYSNIELEVKIDGKKQWVGLNKYLVPIPGERGKRNVHSVAKYIHDNLYEEVWSKI